MRQAIAFWLNKTPPKGRSGQALKRESIMTINQKAAALATLEARMDNIRRLLERETDPEWRMDLNESMEDLEGAYAAIDAIESAD